MHFTISEAGSIGTRDIRVQLACLSPRYWDGGSPPIFLYPIRAADDGKGRTIPSVAPDAVRNTKPTRISPSAVCRPSSPGLRSKGRAQG